MTGYLDNIEQRTLENTSFRQVLYTGQHLQLVVMSIQPREEIGQEIHEINDQFLRVEAGEGLLIMDGQEHPVKDGDAFIVPAGTQHNIVNTSADQPLKLYTLYAPPHHKDGVVHETREAAEADEDDHL